MKADTAFFVYAEFLDTDETVCTTVTPAPEFSEIDGVMRHAAKEIYAKVNKLPVLVIGVERVRYTEVNPEGADVNMMDSGLVIVAMDCQTAEGIAMLYSLPDKEYISSHEFDREASENVPPYTLIAIAAFVHEILVQSDLLEGEDEEDDNGVGNRPIRVSFGKN